MISPLELVLRLVVAAVLGGLVGLERERLEWAAGMRTHALVSLG
jgi:putative Mg2+ transporter-C (MgtC) family protein